jgi:hypothetical protein
VGNDRHRLSLGGKSTLNRWGWLYLVALAAGSTLVVLPVDYSHPAHGVIAQAAAAAVLAVAAFRAQGRIAREVVVDFQERYLAIERAVLLQAGFAFLFGAAASLNGVSLAGADRAWTLAAVGVAAWALVWACGRRSDYYWTFAPVAVAGMTLAAGVATDSALTATAVLAVATVAPAGAYLTSRRWMLLGVANSFLMLTVWAAWLWREGDLAYLPLAFAGLAAIEWVALIRLRRYVPLPPRRMSSSPSPGDRGS